MAFDKDNLHKLGGNMLGLTTYFYSTSVDDIATVKANGYFVTTTFNVGDIIFIEATDGPRVARVSAGGTSTVETVDYTGVLPADDSIEASHLKDTAAYYYAGLFTTTAGSSTQTLTVTGAAVGDVVTATMNTRGATPRGIESKKVTAANTVTFEFSGDPGNDHVVNVVLFKPKS